MPPKRILVLCTHNSARSQMAEAWLRQLSQELKLDAEIWSAGTEKTRVKPEASEVMREVGADLSKHWSKTIDELPARESFDAVLTVCDHANETCPFFPSARRYHISIPDPSGHPLERWRESRDLLGRAAKILVDHLADGKWPADKGLGL